jgi:tellurite resistance protein TerC
MVAVTAWSLSFIIIVFMLSLDLGIFSKKKDGMTMKNAIIWTLIWLFLALAFNAYVYFQFGKEMATQFFTAYLIERSLSFDNLFVFLLIFNSFMIDKKNQYKVLFWAIIAALIMRACMIFVGTTLIRNFAWLLYLFGAFLLYSGARILFSEEKKVDHKDNTVVRIVKNIMPVSNKPSNGNFFTIENAKRHATMLFVCLLVMTFADIVFALDSIPAIISISRNMFILITSNVFAVLGLRALYFVVMRAHNYFKLLNAGLAVILIFIGLRMLLESYVEIPVRLSLEMIVLILSIFIALSLYYAPSGNKLKDAEEN